MNILKVLLTFCVVGMSFPAHSQQEVRFGNEANDTTVISQILDSASGRIFSTPEARTAYFGRQFIGRPYAAHTLELDPEMLTIRTDSLDCTTFVETAIALSLTIGEGRSSWRDFVYNLRRIRYRGGEVDGYPSRLHYISEWIVDNHYRGNLNDATTLFPRSNYILKSLDFMSSNRDRYHALDDNDNLQRIRRTEEGYRNHKFPYIKTVDLGLKANKQAFREGDIVALVSNIKNLDVAHMGIIVLVDGEPYLLHASSTGGIVEISSRPLAEFMKKNRNFIGVRVIRLTE